MKSQFFLPIVWSLNCVAPLAAAEVEPIMKYGDKVFDPVLCGWIDQGEHINGHGVA